MHSSLELLSHGTGSAASCCTHTCFNEESELYIFCFLSCELSLSLSLSYTNTHTHAHTREFTFDYIKLLASPAKILTVAYFCSCFSIPIFCTYFFPVVSFVPYLFASHRLPLVFFPPCLPVFLCSCSLSGNAFQQALLCKYMSQEKQ